MLRCVAPEPSHRARLVAWIQLFACLSLLATLAGCGGGAQHIQRNPSRYYPPPGPPSDPWGPYIHEASGRFGVPELWIRRVMRQESGGQEDVISWAGAMGLMQVMPDTYGDLRSRYDLGDDPFDPHNNILAGTAYIREMYDRYGAPGFLAAYNAGPARLDSYLNNGRPLPDETVNYVAAIAPLLGTERPMSGPLAVYAGAGTRYAAARPTPAACDPDAAYNPDGPCTPLRPAVVVASAAPGSVVASAAPGTVVASAAPVYVAPYPQQPCDPDIAFDPDHPCHAPSAATSVATIAFAPPQPVQQTPRVHPFAPVQRPQPTPQPPPAQRFALGGRPLQERMAQPVAFAPGPPPGRWAIQVGAFANLHMAQTAAETARSAAPDLLRTAKIELPPTAPLGTQIAFRARLFGLSASAASDACARLTRRGTPCLTVPPPHDSF
jgi:hypothetical protein